jgi:hypothetical protein
VYGCEIIEEEKKRQKESVLPDVEKAKREDLQKLQTSPFTTASPKQDTKQQPSTPVTNKSPNLEKKQEPPRKAGVVYKTPGATTNNTIGERNQKNAKEKDCEIY